MNVKKLLLAICLMSIGSAHAALIGRLPATLGGTDYQAYYDTVQNITWLTDANYAQTSGYDADGAMNWHEAQNWVVELNSSQYLGVSDWRLPKVIDPYYVCQAGAPGNPPDCGRDIDTTSGEMAYMYFDNLGNIGYPNSGWGLVNTGPFSNLSSLTYWYSTEYDVNTDFAWVFNFNGGYQGFGNAVDGDKSYERKAWAVVDGNIGSYAVPVPAAVWLFASGLGLLGWMRKRLGIGPTFNSGPTCQ
jgi:hypothetical protein